jgi:hypothetical protein
MWGHHERKTYDAWRHAWILTFIIKSHNIRSTSMKNETCLLEKSQVNFWEMKTLDSMRIYGAHRSEHLYQLSRFSERRTTAKLRTTIWKSDAEKRHVEGATHFQNFITMTSGTAWLLQSVGCSLRHTICFKRWQHCSCLLDREATIVFVLWRINPLLGNGSVNNPPRHTCTQQ